MLSVVDDEVEVEYLFESDWIWQKLVEVFIRQGFFIQQTAEQWNVQLLCVDIDIFIEI